MLLGCETRQVVRTERSEGLHEHLPLTKLHLVDNAERVDTITDVVKEMNLIFTSKRDAAMLCTGAFPNAAEIAWRSTRLLLISSTYS